ncbi:MAG: methionyl-tRNA formyltransferase [Chlamydiales bacterium]|jgi:methionyl-tRNA formyltransferase
MRVVYFGTPVFAAKTLDYLLSKGVNIVGVVTQPDRPKGRSGTPTPCPVKESVLKQSLDIPISQPAKASDPEAAALIQALDADLFVVVAFGEIIRQNLLDMPKIACINVHGSVLPKYRGAAPIQRCIMEGELESGITIMHMAKKMDAGDMIKVVKTPVGENMTYGELEENLCTLGSEALYEVICAFEKGDVERQPQDHDSATYAKKIETSDCELIWDRKAQELHNLVRGVTPRPGAWCQIKVRGKQKRLKIRKTLLNEDSGSQAGEILNFGSEGLVVACGEKSLNILELQLEGKKAMEAAEFVRGFSVQDLSFIF